MRIHSILALIAALACIAYLAIPAGEPRGMEQVVIDLEGGAEPEAGPGIEGPRSQGAGGRETVVAQGRALQPGQHVVVQVAYKVENTMAHADAPAQELAMGFEAPARIVAVDRRDARWVLELRLEGFALTVRTDAGVVDAKALDEHLRQPVLVLLDADDRILGYRFAQGVPAQCKNIVRSVCAAIRLPADASGQAWRGKEGDAGGMATVEVAALDAATGEVRWQRAGYGERVGGIDKPTMQGSGVARFDGQPWWAETDYKETQELKVAQMELVVRQEAEVRTRRVGFGATKVEVPADLWTGRWESAAGDDDAKQAAAEGAGDDERELLEGVEFDAIMQELGFLLGSGRGETKEWWEAHRRLVALLRARPELAEKVLAMLLDPNLDRHVAANLAGAAGAAGTPAMQGVLVKVARTAYLDADRRAGALVALVQVHQPDLAVYQELYALVGDAQLDPRLRGASLYMLGAAAGRADADPQLIAQLLAYEETAIQAGLLDEYLAALGNTGLPVILPIVQQHLASTNPKVRAAAIDALRRLETPEALAILQQHATEDPAAQVRCEAFEALAEHDDAGVWAIYEEGLRDQSIKVREAVVRALGQRDGQQARTLLLQARDTDPSQQIRQLANKLLANN